jgi:hypothetical protein
MVASTTEAMNLHDHETEIELALRNLPRPWARPLSVFLKQALREQRAMASRGRRSAAAYSQRVEQGIRQAIGTLPPAAWALGVHNIARQVWDWIGNERHGGPQRFNLRRTPDIEIIRRVVRKVLDEQKSAADDSLSVDSPKAPGILAA